MSYRNTLQPDDPNDIRPSFIEAPQKFSYLSSKEHWVPRRLGNDLNLDDSDDNLPTEKHSMQVYLRIKPIIPNHNVGSRENIISMEGDQAVVLYAVPKRQQKTSHIKHKFTFTKVYSPTTPQEPIFDECVAPLTRAFLRGQNCLIFAYGATNAGKTFTMQGSVDNPGIIPRSLEGIFFNIQDKVCEKANVKPKSFSRVIALTPEQVQCDKEIKQKLLKMDRDSDYNNQLSFNIGVSKCVSSTIVSETGTSETSYKSTLGVSQDSLFSDKGESNSEAEMGYLLWMSFLEVYNENVYDLFTNLSMKGRRQALQLSDDRGGCYVKDATYIQVKNMYEVICLLNVGKTNLHFAATTLNHNSSRSHCVIMLKLIKVEDVEHPTTATVSSLVFCDLAGSERVSKTGTVGVLLKEAGNINTSMLVLGRCISAMKGQNLKMIPFRDSKLTRLFRPFFVAGYIRMIVNASASADMGEETLQTLKFSAIAQKVELDPKGSTVFKVPDQSNLNKKDNVFVFQGFRDALQIEPDEGDDRYDELVALIDKLQKKIEVLREEKGQVEMDVRNELTTEFARYLENLEENNKRHFNSALDDERELAAERVGALNECLEMSKKRVRLSEGEEDDLDEDLVPYKKYLECKSENIELADRLQSALEQLDSFRKTTRKSIHLAGKDRSERTAMEYRMATLERDNITLQEQADALEQLLENRNKQNQELTEKVEELMGEINSEMSQSTTLKASLKKLAQEKDCLSSELKSKMSDLESTNLNIEILEKEVKNGLHWKVSLDEFVVNSTEMKQKFEIQLRDVQEKLKETESQLQSKSGEQSTMSNLLKEEIERQRKIIKDQDFGINNLNQALQGKDVELESFLLNRNTLILKYETMYKQSQESLVRERREVTRLQETMARFTPSKSVEPKMETFLSQLKPMEIPVQIKSSKKGKTPGSTRKQATTPCVPPPPDFLDCQSQDENEYTPQKPTRKNPPRKPKTEPKVQGDDSDENTAAKSHKGKKKLPYRENPKALFLVSPSEDDSTTASPLRELRSNRSNKN